MKPSLNNKQVQKSAREIFESDPKFKMEFGSFENYGAHCMAVIRAHKAANTNHAAVSSSLQAREHVTDVARPIDEYEAEKQAQANWNESPAIRAEFRTYGTYLGYMKALAR